MTIYSYIRGETWAGGKEKEWTDCVAEIVGLFGITGDWSTAALDPGVWYSTVREGGCRFMAAWVKEEEKRPDIGSGREKRKREAGREKRKREAGREKRKREAEETQKARLHRV